MTYRHHGVTSMGLFAVAVGIALYVIARESWLAAAVFVGVNILSTLGVTYTYCTKCACRGQCSHFFIGAISERLYTRRAGVYTAGDYLGMLLSAGIVFAFPMPWLLREPGALIAFAVFGGLGMLEIIVNVCPACPNDRCPTACWKARLRKK